MPPQYRGSDYAVRASPQVIDYRVDLARSASTHESSQRGPAIVGTGDPRARPTATRIHSSLIAHRDSDAPCAQRECVSIWDNFV